jgi:hypothetical protein
VGQHAFIWKRGIYHPAGAEHDAVFVEGDVAVAIGTSKTDVGIPLPSVLSEEKLRLRQLNSRKASGDKEEEERYERSGSQNLKYQRYNKPTQVFVA